MRRIMVEPQSYQEEYRAQASEEGTKRGVGVRMEVHSSHTEFWEDRKVPVGQMSVYCGRYYKAPLEYVTTLASPTEEWSPRAWLESIRESEA